MPRNLPRVSAKAKQTAPKSGASKKIFAATPASFVTAFYSNALPADLSLFSAQEREHIAGSIWDLASKRKPDEFKLRVFNPSEKDGFLVDHTVVEIVHADMPFLVDSVTGLLQNRGIAVHIVFHPVLYIRRNAQHQALGVADSAAEDAVRESFMHVEIDHLFDGAQLEEVENEIAATLRDVSAAVGDWQKMRMRMLDAAQNLPESQKANPSDDDVEEVRAFLNWLAEDNFTFLGYRELSLQTGQGDSAIIKPVPGKGLGVLRDNETRMFGGLRDPNKRNSPALRRYVHQHNVLFVTKTHAITRVHRILPMDAVFIRSFDEKGRAVSEKLFVGLFTSKTYTQTPRDIPFMRRKIAHVVERMALDPKSHNGRSLFHILNTYPHDELFQISEDDLLANARGILQLQERARVALFMRRDPFDRYATFLIYVPRDRYDSILRGKIQKFLEEACKGKALDWHVRLDESRLARAFVTIRLNPDSPYPDAAQLEHDVREICRTWADRLRNSLAAAYGEATTLILLRRYGDAFPESYCDAISPDNAVADVRNLERVRAAPRFVADLSKTGDGRLRLKLLQPERPLLLSESLPLIENMGLKIDYMGGPYEINLKDGAPIFIHEFVGKPARDSWTEFARVKPAFEDALANVWNGDVENDPFNALTLRAGLSWNAVVILRLFARYLIQLRIPYSRDMIAESLLQHPQVAQQIYALFYVRHDPDFKGDRALKQKEIEAELAVSLSKISVLEEDRIIRRYINLVQASLRTNYFRRDDKGQPLSYLSIKFDSNAVDFMPLPKPLYEIFVYSPRVEAVHLRGGKVARGGIRWSDRRDDFRAEILGLMKAQMVKNSVIVPVGSKGGFIVKRPPVDTKEFQAEGIACYKIMMQGLLDLTDNSKNGKIVPPARVVRHDPDDSYLVVAADKGTARFSDIANGISRDYGFWLDDAFASGGSAGYDHKEMGITARGAWEAVKRHFREIGKDIQTQTFTCIGVGDMSGDVFGNGMLLSNYTLLTGAFDHRHIFCDPTPDPAKSFAERKRLFALPTSSWNDYDKKLISKGGGIFARSEKTIKISSEMKKAYGIVADSLSPAELIQAMLKAEVELLYFGGIGTYVKAGSETHDDVGDRANEGLRVDGAELRAKIVGEGANLAMTQRGRIEYAQKGGKLNTDAIDNSAGVDTSDHEVNIKILLRKAVDRKSLTFPARDKLLSSMTKDIASLVLRDNYLQTQILSVMEAHAPEDLSAHERCMQIMEKSGLLNRAVEYLPSDTIIDERQRQGKGLTRPELAVLLAYAKIWLYQKILDSSLPDDAAVQRDVSAYFPQTLQKSYAKDIAQHQLRREIAATVIANDLINHTGIRIILMIDAHDDAESVARAYLLVRESFALPEVWAKIEALDNKVAASTQTHMMITLQGALAQAIDQRLSDRKSLDHLTSAIDLCRKGIDQLTSSVRQTGHQTLILSEKEWRNQDVPQELASRVAGFPILAGAFDLIDLAAKNKMKVGELASLFFGLEKRLELSWLKQLPMLPSQTSWQREAVHAALAELSAQHHRLTAQLAARKAKGKATDVEGWANKNKAALATYDALIVEGHAAGAADLAMLLLANERLKALSA